MLTLPRHNLKLINFSEIFQSQIESNILDDLDSYKLIKNGEVNIKSPAVKRLFYHHVIHDLCEHVLSIKEEEKIVIVYSTVTEPGDHIHEYISTDTFMDFLTKFIKRISKMLPIKILIVDAEISAIDDIMNLQTGECREIINNAKNLSENFDTGAFTFSKARYFAKKYGLEFLSNNYFKQIKSKQLILS
tara:strand:+ start:157 stop:723 length:567 start_codon:yes stop_codon:yes gene_type:complete